MPLQIVLELASNMLDGWAFHSFIAVGYTVFGYILMGNNECSMTLGVRNTGTY